MQSRPPLPPRGQPPQEEEEYAPPSGPPPGFHQRQQQNTSSTAGAPPGFPPVPNEPPPAPSAWNEHFFYSNGRPTPVFEALMKEFWKRLDPRGTGYIAPEVFSGFMEINHFAPDDDVWRRNHQGNLIFSADDVADYELKAAWEAWYFDHKVVVRNPRAKQLPYGGMPMLSQNGFIDVMAVEIAAEPDDRLGGLNNALRHYGVWTERGPVPRHVLPSARAPELQRRVDAAVARSQQTAKERLDAAEVQARIEARGRQAALDIVSDYRYRYY